MPDIAQRLDLRLNLVTVRTPRSRPSCTLPLVVQPVSMVVWSP